MVDYFADPSNQQLLRKLRDLGVNPANEATVQRDGLFSGLTLVITGTLTTMGRSEAEALVEQLGGRAAGSVSKKTDYLVAGENAGSKLDKARALGIKVIDEQAAAVHDGHTGGVAAGLEDAAPHLPDDVV